ncbi:MAG: GDP-mannose 4,6-dehydratase [Candidatus Roizmanbacteria bacterium]
MKKTILITGGAGFIGCNSALYFAKKGYEVSIVDDFSRPGVQENANILKKEIKNLQIITSDVADIEKYKCEIQKAQYILHLAGQTAVTTSIKDPVRDFHTNIYGTFQLLNAIRTLNKDVVLLYSSTNKVYGNLSSHTLSLDAKKEQWINESFSNGIDESSQLDFLSPYGVSKGSADQYVKDWYHSYGVRTVVFRQSCIYGPFQMGVEDQGWVAHFSKQFLLKKPISVYGDGYQVRDLLHVKDLIGAYELAFENIEKCKGEVFNVGGGVGNAYSVRNVLEILKSETKSEISISYHEERLGDQKYFVSANKKLADILGWHVSTKFTEGVKDMLQWQKGYLGVKFE